MPSRVNVTAAVLCGGKGTRLAGVLPDGTPKCLAPVAGRPFLSYVLEHLALQGIYKAVLCTGVHGDVIEQTCGNRFSSPHWEMQLVHSREEEPLGTAGALRNALPYFDTNPILVVNGDTYCPFDLKGVLKSYRPPVMQVDAYRDDDFVPAGMWLLSRRFLDSLPAGPTDLGRAIYEYETASPGSVSHYNLMDGYHDIGTPESYAATEAFLRGRGVIPPKTSLKGKKVFRHYTAEPAYIYGAGPCREDGEIIAEAIVWDNETWIPIKWKYNPSGPDLEKAGSFHFDEGSEA